MRDIDLARQYLEEMDIRIAVVREGNLIYKSDERGIKPIYTLALEMRDGISNASVADRVIGRGAAILCVYMGIGTVHGQLMSDSAMDVLQRAGIQFTYERNCPYIENMDRSDLCPIEKLSMDIEDGDTLLKRIGEFIRE
ncbi:MAG: DUF1893 domain-containing protein [Tissierellia bacterium]|nr:DUF1893 domain-containing protein [Tissierellia bacterium]